MKGLKMEEDFELWKGFGKDLARCAGFRVVEGLYMGLRKFHRISSSGRVLEMIWLWKGFRKGVLERMWEDFE